MKKQSYLSLPLLISLTAILFTQFPSLANAATYYIAPLGSDRTGNGSKDKPWGSLKKAHDNVGPGDTILCRGGTYENSSKQDMQNFSWAASGTPGNPITVAAFPDETPVFHRGSGGNTCINLRPSDGMPSGVGIRHVTFDGLEFDGYNNAISMRGCPSFIDIGGVKTWSFIDCADKKPRFIDNIIIKNCYVRNSFEHGIYPGANVRDLTVKNNIIENTTKVALHLFHEQGVKNADIYNNLIVGGTVGILVYSKAENINIFNNTLHNQSSYGMKFLQGTNIVVKNNILSKSGLRFMRAPGNINEYTFDNNLYYGSVSGHFAELGNTNYANFTSWKSGTGKDTNSVNANPRFVNIGNKNFRLQSNSPAIDAGTALGAPKVDHEEKNRPIDGDDNKTALFDIGAYEFGSKDSPPMALKNLRLK